MCRPIVIRRNEGVEKEIDAMNKGVATYSNNLSSLSYLAAVC